MYITCKNKAVEKLGIALIIVNERCEVYLRLMLFSELEEKC